MLQYIVYRSSAVSLASDSSVFIATCKVLDMNIYKHRYSCKVSYFFLILNIKWHVQAEIIGIKTE